MFVFFFQSLDNAALEEVQLETNEVEAKASLGKLEFVDLLKEC